MGDRSWWQGDPPHLTKKNLKIIFTFTCAYDLPRCLLLAACGGDSDPHPRRRRHGHRELRRQRHASYSASVTGAESLRDAVADFTAAPTTTTQNTAKDAWNASRVPFLQTEVFRFSDGPIDGNAEGTPEIGINAWPLDEVYIDYVEGNATAGLVNDLDFNLTIENLVTANMGEQNDAFVSTGYHAIEFLLWGQDLDDAGPGERPATDYTSADNADRRKQYLDLTAAARRRPHHRPRRVGAGRQRQPTRRVRRARREGSGPSHPDRDRRHGVRELPVSGMQVALETRIKRTSTPASPTRPPRHRRQPSGDRERYLGKFGANDGAGIEVLVMSRDMALHPR